MDTDNYLLLILKPVVLTWIINQISINASSEVKK
jgi:hypothetical protein